MKSEPDAYTEEFQKIIDDFTKDLALSFPELNENFENIDYEAYYNYCKSIYPENFFDILYENGDVFEKPESKYLLPNIDFYKIMNDKGLSDHSKKTIWKYLQLVMFCVCNKVDNKTDFGDAKYLFEAIDEQELQNKLQETMEDMKNIFMNMDMDMSGNIDISDQFGRFTESLFNDFGQGLDESQQQDNSANARGGGFADFMDADKMKDHLSGIMNGKIGSLAKEIATEAGKDLGLNNENMSEEEQQNLMKGLFKNPMKLLGIVKSIGSKLDEKFKSGELKESELLQEAQEIMGKMKDIPGLKQMMAQMGLNQSGGKFDFKGMASKMQSQMRQAKMKERMQEKMKQRKSSVQTTQTTEQKGHPASSGNFTQVQENTFVWNDSNSDPSLPLRKVTKSKSNSKKKSKKKAKKN